MFSLNGSQHHTSDLIFALIDCLLTLAGVFGGIFIRFSNNAEYFLIGEYPILRIMLIVFLIQLGFYFFDLHEPRLYDDRKKMLILLLESFGASSILIFVTYYLIPTLEIGGGVYAISVIFIFTFSFLWRLLYVRVFNSKAFKERVLIIGTGNLAKKVGEEITHSGYQGFEIVGFIDENKYRTRKRIAERI